ncbi:hypothetical protein L2Y94_09100 [Luteibacter aegosomatis]|uniref:hypothetical protein n=1 Tax=Luteibacter aegosomatis TaxID=2911537 RepID=UPI001FFAB41A|nr:hypothetical protein [Luteibacter aegosomatis]UPG87490.1 hypothetical protein L2Y94_09100 [Luteibacter aegosomatis]
MNRRTGTLLVPLVTLLLVACNKKDLSPLPLNPHPKEALLAPSLYFIPAPLQPYRQA